MRSRFFAAFLVVCVAALLQMRIGQFFGVTADVVLAALITFVFFLKFEELFIIALLGAWLINWQPQIGWEFLGAIGIPIFFFLIKQFLPWQAWLGNILFVAVGVLLFCFGIDSALAARQWLLILRDVIVSAVFGTAVFSVFQHWYPHDLSQRRAGGAVRRKP